MVKNLKARGVSDSTITDAVAALSSLLEIARDDGLIEENAARGLRRRQSYRPPANRGLTADELKMFIGRTPVPYRLPVLFLAATGLRFGEMAALRFGDFTNNYTVATIGRSVSTDHTGRLQEGDTKTHKIRVVSVPSTIAQHIREMAREAKPEDHVFVGPRGGVLEAGNFSRAIGIEKWREEVRQPRLGERPVSVRDLRHTTARSLFRNGIEAPVVQSVLGHSNLTTTQIYGSIDKKCVL